MSHCTPDKQESPSDASPPRRPAPPHSPKPNSLNTHGYVSDASPPRRRKTPAARPSRFQHARVQDPDASPPRRPRLSIAQSPRPLLPPSPPATRPAIPHGARALVSAGAHDADGFSRVNGRPDVAAESDAVGRRGDGFASDAVGSAQSAARLDGRPFLEPPRKVLKSHALGRMAADRSLSSLNRYSIAPGPRWDGVDRSNGFEARLERMKAERADAERRIYKASVSDL